MIKTVCKNFVAVTDLVSLTYYIVLDTESSHSILLIVLSAVVSLLSGPSRTSSVANSLDLKHNTAEAGDRRR